MLKKLSLMLLCLSSLCLGMWRGPQQQASRQASRSVSQYLSDAWNRGRAAWNRRINQRFGENAKIMSGEQEKINRALANIKQQGAKLDEIESNAKKEFNRRSWLEFLTGKSSYADQERRRNALETNQKVWGQWKILQNKEAILNNRKWMLEDEAKDMAQFYQNRAR